MNVLARFFDRCASHGDSLYKALLIICMGLFVADFFYHKHGHFDFESIPGFYLFYGFIAYCAIVLTAKLLRKILQREEDYYDDQ